MKKFIEMLRSDFENQKPTSDEKYSESRFKEALVNFRQEISKEQNIKLGRIVSMQNFYYEKVIERAIEYGFLIFCKFKNSIDNGKIEEDVEECTHNNFLFFDFIITLI